MPDYSRAKCRIVCDYLLCYVEDKKAPLTSQIYYSHGDSDGIQNI